ncbi:MAG: hypothetical protein VYA34_00600 [Myxococcota bacterium]|nr:hypothetical protein [Myxococcota bacterium]
MGLLENERNTDSCYILDYAHQSRVMKKPLRCLGLSILLFNLTCGELDQVHVQKTARASIQGTSIIEILVSDLGFGDFLNITLRDKEEFKDLGVEPPQIDSATLTSFRLKILSGDENQDLTFLGTIKFFMTCRDLPPVEIASGGPFEKGATELDLTVSSAELRDYVASESITIISQVNGKRPRSFTKLEATADFLIDVNTGGVLCAP